jgi:inhibitor of KinA
MKGAIYSIFPLGDSAIIIDFGNTIEMGVNQKVLALCDSVEAAGIAGVLDIVPAYSSVTVHYDVCRIVKSNTTTTAYSALKDNLQKLVSASVEKVFTQSRKLRIPVCYHPTYGLDLGEVALFANMTVEEAVHLHTSRTYTVFMVGFLPGFAYMGEVDERIALPRKSEPRLEIKAGSVGIAGRQTGIYPLTSPGGWQIIGRTPVKSFDKTKAEPVLFTAGDKVEFFSITEDEFDRY